MILSVGIGDEIEVRMRPLSVLLLALLAGCGSSISPEAKRTYQVAAEAMDKEAFELSKMMEMKDQIENGETVYLRNEVSRKFDAERKPDKRKFGSNREEYEQAHRAYLEERRKFEETELNLIGTPETPPHWDTLVERRKKATARIDPLIEEQRARFEQAEQRAQAAEAALRK